MCLISLMQYNILMLVLDTKNTTPEEIISKTISVLASGGLVIFPTETIYGIGADATNQNAIDKLLAYKSRREGKPLSIAVTDINMAEQYVEINDQARDLYERFLPGPLTIVSKSKGTVANGVASEFGTLGTRIPAYPLILDIVKAFGKPMTATSANASDGRKPYTIQHVLDSLSDKQKSLIDLIIDAGELPKNPPSTVIDTTLSTPVTLREGQMITDNRDSRTENGETRIQLISNSEEETKGIAGRLLLKHWNAIRGKGLAQGSRGGLVIGLSGPLGAGKTIFTKGIAEFLGITETITSPTYTYIEEYDFIRHQTSGKLYHLDLWKVETEDEFKRLEVEKLIQQNTVVVVEWIANVWPYLMPELEKHNIPTLLILISEEDKHRKIEITEIS